MKITSVFNQGEKIPVKYTADGENINPSLEVIGIPSDIKSLVLIVDDPDAPAGTWVHWVVINISPEINTIRENSIPKGAIQVTNSAGEKNYHGPAPPSGVHHYFFKIYALDTFLSLTEDKTKKDIEKAMQNHIIDKAELIGIYSRDKLS